MVKWVGILETFGECEAETEEEAKRKMAEALVRDFQSGGNYFIVWPKVNKNG